MPYRDLTDDRAAMRALTGRPPLPPPPSLWQLVGQCFVDIWRGLMTFAVFVVPALARPKPLPLPARGPRHRRPVRSLETAAVDEVLAQTCLICGMDDPDRFRLGIGAGEWRGWPAHQTCGTRKRRKPGTAIAQVQLFAGSLTRRPRCRGGLARLHAG
jgi:hypothetical protein